MDQPPYHLDSTRRDVVLQAIQGVCAHRGWNLLAAHMRSNHVHTVVAAEAPPERIRNDCKADASRRLNQIGLEQPGRKRWARHGSSRCFGSRRMSRRPSCTSLRSRVTP
jgi:REP element-mobilizing transposase RayT